MTCWFYIYTFIILQYKSKTINYHNLQTIIYHNISHNYNSLIIVLSDLNLLLVIVLEFHRAKTVVYNFPFAIHGRDQEGLIEHFEALLVLYLASDLD
jgi:hypothetical protein